jgi:hypothetical protein
MAGVMAKSKTDVPYYVLDDEDDPHPQDELTRPRKRPANLMSTAELATMGPAISKRRKDINNIWIDYKHVIKDWKFWAHDLTGAPWAPTGLHADEWKAVCIDEPWLDIARFATRNTSVASAPAPTISIELEGLGTVPFTNTQRKSSPIADCGDFLVALERWANAVNTAYRQKGAKLGMRHEELDAYRRWISRKYSRQEWSVQRLVHFDYHMRSRQAEERDFFLDELDTAYGATIVRDVEQLWERDRDRIAQRPAARRFEGQSGRDRGAGGRRPLCRFARTERGCARPDCNFYHPPGTKFAARNGNGGNGNGARVEDVEGVTRVAGRQ